MIKTIVVFFKTRRPPKKRKNMKQKSWQDRHYEETNRGKKNHPNNDCIDKKPFFLSVIENSPYFACDNCNTAWVAKTKYTKDIQLLYR